MIVKWLCGLILLFPLAACSSNLAQAVPTATAGPALAATAVVPPTKTAASATSVPIPTKGASAQPATGASAPTDTIAETPMVTATPALIRPRPTATSSGPLAATIYVASCHSAPTADKPGRVIVQISVEASGGNGAFQYIYLDKAAPTKFIEVVGEKGTRAIGAVRITSGDGQELKKEFDIGIGGLSCR